MALAPMPRLTSGGFELDTSPERFQWLRDSSELVGDFAALRARMEEDGYLFLPGFLDRQAVAEVRHSICQRLEDEQLLDPAFPADCAIAREGIEMYFRPDIANSGESSQRLRQVIYGERMMDFYAGLLGGPARHFDYTWMRAIAPGKGTYPHCDVVYMGRGTPQLYTAWVPLGDVPLHVGGLVLMPGSHRDAGLQAGYCQTDVDTACQNRDNASQPNAAGFPGFGALSLDIADLRQQLGYRIATASEYRMGDLLTFSVFTVHGSLDNHSREIRMSSDSRYQLASEPADERWVGDAPPGHGGAMVRGLIC